MPSRPDVAERHRLRRIETRRRLLDAARDLLEQLSWSQVSVELITDRVGLTRSAFYKHFADLPELLMALLDEIGDELSDTPAAWESATGGDPKQQLADALAALVEAFRAHGRLIRAIADEATRDEELARRYAELGAALSAGVTERIARDVAEGRSALEDPEEVATALVWMNERFLIQRFGRPPLGDPARATAALAEVWNRTLYGDA